LQERSTEIHNLLTIVCDWMMNEEIQKPDSCEWLRPKRDSKKIDEIITMLKYIKRSVDKWNKKGGRQGYLKLIEPFIITK